MRHLALAFLFLCSAAHAQVGQIPWAVQPGIPFGAAYYVATNGSDSNNGLSPIGGVKGMTPMGDGWALTTLTAPQLASVIADLQALGVSWVRYEMDATVIDPSCGSMTWGNNDAAISALRAASINVLALLNTASGCMNGSGPGTQGPTSSGGRTAWAAFATAVVQRYGASGSAVPGGISAYEIWNEPNCGIFWTPGADPTNYEALVASAHAAIVAADPTAQVVSGGLATCGDTGTTQTMQKFLANIYAAGLHGNAKAIGIHPYCPSPVGTAGCSNIRAMYDATYLTGSGATCLAAGTPEACTILAIMTANGDGALKIWSTEFGQGTTQQLCCQSADDQTQQAADVTSFYNLLTANANTWAGPGFWYNYEDFVSASGTGADGKPQCTASADSGFLCDGLELYSATGVGTAKLSYAAFQAVGTLGPFATLGKCQTAMRAALKPCYVRGGIYALPSGGLILTTSDNGETFQYYSPDGVNSPILTTALVASAPAIGISCVGCTLKGLTLAVNGSLDSGCVTITASCIPIEISGANGLQFLSNVIDGENAASPYYLIDVNGPVSGAIIVGNTLKNWGSAGGGDGIILNGTLTNSVVRNNTFSCLTQYGLIDAGGATGNLFVNNTFNLIGENPCGTISGGGGGAGINLQADSGNLLHGNVFTGFQLGYNFVLNNTLGANFIQSNTLGMGANPQMTLNGAPSTVVRKNVVSAPAGANGFNLGDEHDSPSARTNTSNNLLVLNNQITSGLEGLYLTGTSNSIILGNVITQSGNSTSGSQCGVPTPHYAAGLAVAEWSCVNGGSHNNLILLNTISNTLGTADWGMLLDTAQNNNTVEFNVVNHNPTPIADNSGGPNTIANNQTTSSPTPLATAPPIADAGAGAVVASQAAVTLDGSATHLITGGTSGITYLWTQILGPTVGVTGGTLVQASFTAPGVSVPTILGFRLTASNGNGSTYDQVYFGVDPSL